MTKKIRALKSISEKVLEIATSADEYPGIVIIHNVKKDFNKIEYMSQRGLKLLDISMRDLRAMGSDYFPRYFNTEDAGYLPSMLQLIKDNDINQIFSYFPQLRYSLTGPWNWYSSSTKLILQDEAGQPLLCLTFAIPMSSTHYLAYKVARMLKEDNFSKDHFKDFSNLTKREKEVLKELALGCASLEIAEKFHITKETVKTHRKNIYQKLSIKSSFDISEYARAFDLI